MKVRNYIVRAAREHGISEASVDGVVSRMLGNLAVAGIRENHEATALTRTSVDALLQRLEKRLGKNAVANPKDNAPVLPGRKVSKTGNVPDSNRLRKRGVEVQKDDFDPAATESYANALRNGEDPDTGAKLSGIELMPGIKALHNPVTRVVYPIPGDNALPGRV